MTNVYNRRDIFPAVPVYVLAKDVPLPNLLFLLLPYLCGAGVVTVFTLERPLPAVPVHVLVHVLPVSNLLLPVWCSSSHSVYT
jgi:hypothetical protein